MMGNKSMRTLTFNNLSTFDVLASVNASEMNNNRQRAHSKLQTIVVRSKCVHFPVEILIMLDVNGEKCSE